MSTEIGSDDIPVETAPVTLAPGRRHGVTPIDPPAHSQWPFVERRRRKTDRRQNNAARALMEIGRTNAPDELRALTDLRAPDVSRLCTVREKQVMRLLMQGMTNKRIAEQLGIMEDTVKKHLQHIYDKLGVRRRTLVILGRLGGG